MNKATLLRARLQHAPITPTKEQVEPVYLSQTNNARIMHKLDALQRKLRIETYIVMHEDEPQATIVFKFTENTCLSIVTRHINGRRALTEKTIRGRGFDRATASLDGLIFYSPRFCLEDKDKRWYDQLAGAGFKVWRTL